MSTYLNLVLSYPYHVFVVCSIRFQVKSVSSLHSSALTLTQHVYNDMK